MGVREFLVAFAGIVLCATAFAASERVDVPADSLTLHGILYRPAGDGPFPAVVALHDCGGLTRRPATQSQLYNQWADLLVARGFVVLFPDSYGSRGLASQCRERTRKVHARRERVADANAHDGGADFRSAVALYPGCRRLRETAWSARIPTLILVGSADDWTPASVCQQMVAGAHDRSARAEIIVYPGAFHEFDRANSPIRLRTGLVNTADPSGRAHGGTNPAARTDALKRVPQWLAK
jgi:dienelactone hydrolase